MYGLVQTSQPIAEPVSLATAKQFAVVGVGFTDDDALLSGFVTAARTAGEQYTNRAFFNRSMRLSLDYFPLWWPYGRTKHVSDGYYPYLYIFQAQMILVPLPGLVSVTSITYLDQTNTLQTLDPSTYYVDTSSEPGRISPVTSWPTASMFIPGSVQITYVAGSFGDGVEVDICPGNVSTATALLAAWMYSNREGAVPIPQAFYTLLDPVKFETFGMGY